MIVGSVILFVNQLWIQILHRVKIEKGLSQYIIIISCFYRLLRRSILRYFNEDLKKIEIGCSEIFAKIQIIFLIFSENILKMHIDGTSRIDDSDCLSPSQLQSELSFLSDTIPRANTQIARRKMKLSSFLQYDIEELQNTARKKTLQRKKLRQKFKGLKKDIISRYFIAKLERNNQFSKPVNIELFNNNSTSKHWDVDGFEFSPKIETAFDIISLITNLLLIIIFTLSLPFANVVQNSFIQKLIIWTLIFQFIEIVKNFITVTFQNGVKLTKIKEIAIQYSKNKFFLDFICMLITFQHLFTIDVPELAYLRLFVIFKLKSEMQKLQKLENFFLTNFYKQQYWKLVKVFIFNFFFAHILAVALVTMANLQPEQENWVFHKGLLQAQWYQLYSWAYYWAATTMLTVGYGDLSATNYREAICLTIIELFSCILLAYNINCVGQLISNIRSHQIQKTKNHKIFRNLSQKNEISQDLQHKIDNYIEQSINIKKDFNFQQENQFILHLPSQLKAEYLKQANKKLFFSLPFFKKITQKTLLKFAESLEMKIYHPQEFINRKAQNDLAVMILKEGKLSQCAKISNSNFDGTIVDIIKVDDSKPYLLSLDFISGKRDNFQLKSWGYSIIYYLGYEKLISLMSSCDKDYEQFCKNRDLSRHYIDSLEVHDCQHCKLKHTKFECPRYHYIPFKSLVVSRYLQKLKSQVCRRQSSMRISADRAVCALGYYKIIGKKKYHYNAYISNKNVQTDQALSTPYDQNLELLGISKKYLAGSDKSITSQHIINYFQGAAEYFKNQVLKIVVNDELNLFWDTESDKAKNYRNYFSYNNSDKTISFEKIKKNKNACLVVDQC